MIPYAYRQSVEGRGIIYVIKIIFKGKINNLLVNGRLIVMLERNPSGGYLTNGMEMVGVMVRRVPGGSASLPSLVIHRILFCLWLIFSFSWQKLLTNSPINISNHLPIAKRTIRNMITLTSIRFRSTKY